MTDSKAAVVKRFSTKRGTAVRSERAIPQEVIVYDCLQKQRAIGEYRHEIKQWFSMKLYKVYHPAFEGGYRWVSNIIRYLGPIEGN